MMTRIIGGKSDGDESPVKMPRMTIGDETYMLVGFREGGKEYLFYQLAGMKPAEAQVQFRKYLK